MPFTLATDASSKPSHDRADVSIPPASTHCGVVTNSSLSVLGQNVKDCANIIRFKPNDQKYHDFNSARAEPNQRLKEVFGIDNSFTSIDRTWRSEFIRYTVFRMKTATKLDDGYPEGNWMNLKRSAITSFKEYVEQAQETLTLNAAELVQFVTLRVSLVYLFDKAEEAMANNGFENVKYVGRRINELWIASKDEKSRRPVWKDETRLHTALLALTTVPEERTPPIPGAFPSDTDGEADIAVDPLIPKLNPMNLLLPAYETMWRVVLRCMLEVQYRDNEKSTGWKSVLEEYLDGLDVVDGDSFWKLGANGVSPADVVKEALRLYPPSRRVHRTFHGNSLSADIEGCHRSQRLGQDDPLTFRPERWQSICPALRTMTTLEEKGAEDSLKAGEESLGFMPFAFVCPADTKETKRFGMKLIALLVAVLVEGLAKEWVLEDQHELPDICVPLNTNRWAYEGLELRKKYKF